MSGIYHSDSEGNSPLLSPRSEDSAVERAEKSIEMSKRAVLVIGQQDEESSGEEDSIDKTQHIRPFNSNEPSSQESNVETGYFPYQDPLLRQPAHFTEPEFASQVASPPVQPMPFQQYPFPPTQIVQQVIQQPFNRAPRTSSLQSRMSSL